PAIYSRFAHRQSPPAYFPFIMVTGLEWVWPSDLNTTLCLTYASVVHVYLDVRVRRKRGGCVTAQLTEDARRAAILDAAAQLIAERGYHSVRVSDIASLVGISTGAVHYYFPTKGDVLTAALRHVVDRTLERQRH